MIRLSLAAYSFFGSVLRCATASGLNTKPTSHRAAGVIVDHALKISAEHGSAPSTLLDLAISFADFSPLRTK